MAATPHHHRKLIQPPTNTTTTTTISHFCMFECDPQLNPTGVCSADCTSFCPPFCNTTSSPTSSPATAPYSFPPPSHHPHPPLPLPLKISLIFLLVTFIYTLYKFYSVCHRSRPHPTSPENQESPDLQIHHLYDDDGTISGVVDHPIWYIRTTGLNPSVINNLAIVKFSKADASIEVTDCSVCLSEFEQDDVLRLLPSCKHAFHISCIDTWLRSHTNCPLCRAIVVNSDSPPPEESRSDLGFVREISLGVSSIRDVGVDQGSASGSSGLRIGGIDEDDVNNNDKQQ